MPASKYFVSLLRPENHENTDMMNERAVSVKDSDPAAMATPCKILYFRNQPRFQGSSSVFAVLVDRYECGRPFPLLLEANCPEVCATHDYSADMCQLIYVAYLLRHLIFA